MADLSSISAEQRLQLLVNAVIDYAIYMLDPEGQVTTWNPGAERFKGYAADEIIGEHFSRFFTEEDRAADLPGRALRIAAREGRFEAEGWRIRKDGTRFWAHADHRPDPQRRRVADRLRQDHPRHHRPARARAALCSKASSASGCLSKAFATMRSTCSIREGRITNWNVGRPADQGLHRGRDRRRAFLALLHRGRPRRRRAAARSGDRADEGKYEREAWRVRKDGSLFWAHVVIDPIFNDDGKHVGFAKITRDVTERKQAEEELEETRDALAQSQKLQALGELTGGIAHDFNNLMTVISGSADFLLRRPDLPDEKRQQYLQAIAETAARATTLTNHLLAFGRRQTIKPEVIDVNVRIDALAEMLVRTLGTKYRVELDLDARRATVEVDAAQLETALLNAALNARDAMPDGGKLTISTADVTEDEGQRFVRIGIADTGDGMPQGVLDRAFEPFFTTKDVGKGTGLGLSQIHGFAAQAGGRAEISSTRARDDDHRAAAGKRQAASRHGRRSAAVEYPAREPACCWSRTISRFGNLPRVCSRPWLRGYRRWTMARKRSRCSKKPISTCCFPTSSCPG